jgi:hypothetical protein
MATGRGGRTSTQRKSVAKKNPTRGVTAADKKITKLNKGSANSGTGKRAQANNAARSQRVSDINRKKDKTHAARVARGSRY